MHNIHSIGGGSALSNINAVLYSVPTSNKDICNMFIIFHEMYKLIIRYNTLIYKMIPNAWKYYI